MIKKLITDNEPRVDETPCRHINELTLLVMQILKRRTVKRIMQIQANSRGTRSLLANQSNSSLISFSSSIILHSRPIFFLSPFNLSCHSQSFLCEHDCVKRACIAMAFMDSETGEIVMNSNLLECNLDVETGECVGNESETDVEPKQNNSIRKTKFNVPKAYLVQTEPPKKKEKCCLGQQETCTLTSKKRVMQLKEVTQNLVRQFRNFNI